MVRTQTAAASSSSSSGLLSAGQGVALCVLSLLVIGVVMVNSAGMSVEQTREVTAESLLLSKSTIYMALAVAAMLGTALLPVRRVAARWVERPRRKDRVEEMGAVPGAVGAGGTWGVEGQPEGSNPPPSPLPLGDGMRASSFVGDWFRHMLELWPLWSFVCVMIMVLGLVYVPGIGKQVNHSHRWVNLHAPGLDSVQPSEIAKWALIVAIAWFGCRNAKHMKSFWKGLVPGLAAAGAVSAVIVLEDLGTGALLGMVACLILIAAGVRLWHLLLLAPLPLAAIGAAIVTSPYRMHRILAFLNPYEDPQGIGYHMIQSMVAVANGQFFGRGLGHGLQKFGYLPEDTTDFLFAIVCEELGVFGAALVMFLYGAMLWCILGIIRREPSRFLRLVALGVMATVGLQAVINLAVVTGLGPTKGIALPLLSSGGTGWILTAASLGLVIAMDRTRAMAGMYEVEEEIAETVAAVEMVEEVEAAPAVVGGGTTLIPDDPRFAPPQVQMLTSVEEPAVGTVSMTIEEGVQAASSVDAEALTKTEDVRIAETLVAPSMDVPAGQTGVLFKDVEKEATEAPKAAAPEVIVTPEAKDWPPPMPSHRIAPA